MSLNKLDELHTQLDQYRDAIYDSGSNLSRMAGVRIGHCAEIKMQGHQNVILGGYGYMGVIDDYAKKIVALPNGSTVCHHAFNSVYAPLEQAGYEIECLKSSRFLGSGDDSAVLNFLVASHVTRFAQTVLNGKHFPEGAAFTNLSGDEDYEMNKMIGSARSIGGDVGEAFALHAAVASGKMDVVHVSPSSRTSLDMRSVAAISWPKIGPGYGASRYDDPYVIR